MSGSSSRHINVDGETIYFSNMSDGGKLYKLDIEGKGPETRLNDDESVGINVIGEWIYYMDAGEDLGTYRIKTDGTGRERLDGISEEPSP
ncbi:MAG: hypothetical protein HPY66_3114 [Firmicutes bacterium]|nr:hypothetical protein [Bacillota bacterium]